VASGIVLFLFSPSLLRRILLLIRQAIWEMRQQMVNNGRLSGTSQVYLPMANRIG
jgi:hypothetical protein